MSEIKLYSMASTHGNFDEGGGKVHIATDDGNVLCGYNDLFSPNEINSEWVTQPDPDKNMCQKCKKIALKLIKINQ